MDNFNYQLNSRNESDCLEQLEFSCENNFINRSEFTSSDVERVLMEAHESLLSSMDPIGVCQDTNSFLNPMSDILGDISDLNKTFSASNAIAPCSQPPQITPSGLSVMNCNWPMTDTTSLIGVPSAPTSNESVANDSGFFNLSSGSSNQLLPENVYVEYNNTDCAFLGNDYSTSFSQLFQNFEQQQLSFMSTPVPPAQQLQPNASNFSDAFLSTIGSLPSSTTITPITGEVRQIGYRPLSPVQQEVTIEARFSTDSENKPNQLDNENLSNLPEFTPHLFPVPNFTQRYEENNQIQNTIKRKSVYGQESIYQANFLPPQKQKIITVFNQNQCSQMMASMPIVGGNTPNKSLCGDSQKARTSTVDTASAASSKRSPVQFQPNRFNWTAVFPRKHFIHPPEMIIMHPLRTRKLMTSRKAVSTGTTLELSEYFDTSSVDIPMIPERPRAEGKNENRRKQKLNIIPGSENFVFEVLRNEDHDSESTTTILDENWGAEHDPYPETELPELEEIFKRKKKNNVSIPTGKRSITGPQIVIGPPQKKQCSNNVIRQQSTIQESSASFEEKVSLSISIRQGRSKLVDRIDTSSESDSLESETGSAQVAKSLKCLKCLKLFKTTRSLAIHTKRCTAVPKEPSLTESDSNEDVSNIIYKGFETNNPSTEDSSKSSDMRLIDNDDGEDLKKAKVSDSTLVADIKPRPITRSQTKSSTRYSIKSSITSKRSK